jgi:hypothetical protein
MFVIHSFAAETSPHNRVSPRLDTIEIKKDEAEVTIQNQ